MKILFRADGNLSVGAGHVMRCLSIAESAIELGAEAVFATADDSLAPLIKNRGIELRILNSYYRDLEFELQQLRSLIETESADLVVIDSYFVTEEYLSRLEGSVPLVYIDDIMQTAYKVDYIVNYNAYANKDVYVKLYEAACLPLPRLVLGAEYAPLRKEFQGVERRPVSNHVQNVLVLVGGTDPERMAIRIADYAVSLGETFPRRAYHFVVGDLEPDLPALVALGNENEQIVIHRNVERMAELMACMDVAISASGSTLYELCACGVPTINYCLEENQAMVASFFSDKGIVLFAGDDRKDNDLVERIFLELDRVCENIDLRKHLSESSSCLVDGKGAIRLVEVLLLGSDEASQA